MILNFQECGFDLLQSETKYDVVLDKPILTSIVGYLRYDTARHGPSPS